MIYLTSFKRFHEGKVDMPGYSIAVYQPRWYPELPEVDLFDIRDDAGWVRPRLFEGQSTPLLRYHDRLVFMYRQRFNHDCEIGLSLYRDHFDQHEDVALCCWCPYDKAAQRQLEEYGTFVCHSWPVETFLKSLGFDTERDPDRHNAMVSCTSDLGFDDAVL